MHLVDFVRYHSKANLLPHLLCTMSCIFTQQDCLNTIEAMALGEVSEDSLQQLCKLLFSAKFYSQLEKIIYLMRNDPIVLLLEFKGTSLEELFQRTEGDLTPESVACILEAIFSAQVLPTFYKINIHAAMTPFEIDDFLTPIFNQARFLQKKRNFSSYGPEEMPYITVRVQRVC